MTKEQAIKEAVEYLTKYKDFAKKFDGVDLKVRIVELLHDSMGNKYDEPTYAWHDYSDGVFAKNIWKDEPTVMIIE